MPTLGTFIKHMRTSLGMTQEQLAQAAEVSRPAIAQYESDLRRPGPEILERLARGLGVNPEDLMDDITSSPKGPLFNGERLPHLTKLAAEIQETVLRHCENPQEMYYVIHILSHALDSWNPLRRQAEFQTIIMKNGKRGDQY